MTEQPSMGWLLNHLVLAASAKGYQQDRPGIADEDRITDADIEKIEAQILALASASASPHAKGIQRHRYVPDVYVGAACKVCGLEQHHHFHATEPPSARPASLEEPQQPQEQK